jgi:glucose/arabinose dehydrogenase
MRRLVASLSAVFAIALAASGSASAGTVPSGFQETTAFSGLTNPTVVRFAPDGRVFVAEKSGLIKVFDGLGDSTPTVFADLRTEVHNFWDRGLLGMELSHHWDGWPWVYVSYTHDAAVGGTAPRWGTPGATSDPCPTPPGPTGDGCVVSGRVSRLSVSGDGTVQETVLVEDWCQQYPSHSIGSLENDPWGGLYVSGGDGASFNFTDYGQDGSPTNPCGDPPTGPGTALTPPTAQGGALRSQDIRTSGDPTGLDGTIARIDPRDGSGLSVNPRAGSSDPNERRIIAHGLRNPFRFTISPDGDIWVGDVGWNTWEEINRFGYFDFANFGWPCYEGNGRQSGYDAADLSLCENLYSTTEAKAPFFTYNHSAKVVAGETCPTGSSSISGLRFYDGATYPAAYGNALFFSDYSRDCIWVMRQGANGDPDPSTVATFDAGASNPVYLEIGPDGALYYADFDGGRIQRSQYSAANQPPVAVADANPQSGNAPLTVQFDGSGSSDPDTGDSLTYDWDLDADGEYDDSTAVNPTYTYTQTGSYNASLKVTDSHGASSTAPVTIDVGNTPPVPTITSPTSSTKWRVGQLISFAGSANDAQDGPLPASALDWTLTLQHCPSNCHSHVIQGFDNTAGGTFNAPDHEYPSYLELTLTATDSGGLSASKTVRLDPSTISLTLDANYSSLSLSLNGVSATVPFTRTVIQGSANSISAPTPQSLKGRTYDFRRWSDGGARTHNVSPASSKTYTAHYRRR